MPTQPAHQPGAKILPPSGHASKVILLTESNAEGVNSRFTLGATPVRVTLPLSEDARSTARELSRDPAPRWFLRINDIRTTESPGFYYAIYIDPPKGVPLDSHTPGFVGTLSVFTMRPHKMPGGKLMANTGVSIQYNISELIGPLISRDRSETTVVFAPHGRLILAGSNCRCLQRLTSPQAKFRLPVNSDFISQARRASRCGSRFTLGAKVRAPRRIGHSSPPV